MGEFEVFIESRFPARNMTGEERMYYLNIISLLKDVSSSERINTDNKVFKLVEITLKKLNDNSIHFDGGISNGTENRYVTGNIVKNDNTIQVITKFERLSNPNIPTREKEYKTYDMFVMNEDFIYRESKYTDDYRKYEDELPIFSELKSDKYYK